ITAVEETTFNIRKAEEREEQAATVYEHTLERLNESDARMSAVAEQLGHLGSAARAARADGERLETQIAEAKERLEAESQELASLAERLAAAEAEPEQTEADTAQAQEQRDEDAQAAVAARARETEARLAL